MSSSLNDGLHAVVKANVAVHVKYLLLHNMIQAMELKVAQQTYHGHLRELLLAVVLAR